MVKINQNKHMFIFNFIDKLYFERYTFSKVVRLTKRNGVKNMNGNMYGNMNENMYGNMNGNSYQNKSNESKKIKPIIIILINIVIIGAMIIFFANFNKQLDIAHAATYKAEVEKMIIKLNSKPGDRKIVDGVYEIAELGLEINNSPKSGWVIIKNQNIESYSLEYKVVVNLEDNNVSTSSSVRHVPNKNLKSKEVEEYCKIVQAASDRVITKGDKYSCDPGDGKQRIFYVLEIKEDVVNMIMDRNIGDNVPWCKRGTALAYDKRCNGDGVKEALATRTSGWKNVKVSLPTYNQLMWVNNKGDVSFREYPFIHSSGENKDSCYVTDSSCVELVGNETPNLKTSGYWLETASWLGVNCAFNLEFGTRSIFYHAVGTPTRMGIRPVITVNRV